MTSLCGSCASPTHGRPFCGECGQPTDSVTVALDGPAMVVERAGRGRKVVSGLAVVAVLAIGGILLFSGGDEPEDDQPAVAETTTTASPTTTSAVQADSENPTATTVLSNQDTLPPVVPSIGRSLDAYVLAVEGPVLRRTDLDTGEVVEVDLDGQRQRTLHVVGEEVAMLEVNTGELHEVIVEPLGLGRSVALLPGSFPQSDSGSALAFQGEINDLEGSSYQVFRSFDAPVEEVRFPSEFFVFSVVPADDRLVLNSVVGSFLWDGEQVQETIDGFVLATDGLRALWYGCDERLDCGVYLGDLGSDGRRLDAAGQVVSPFAFGFGSTSQLAGMVLSIDFSNPTSSSSEGVLDVAVIRLSDGEVSTHQLELDSATPSDPFGWRLLPDGTGLVNRSEIFDFECGCAVPYADLPFGGQNFGQVGLVAIAKR